MEAENFYNFVENDIVSSIWKHVAVHRRTCTRVASCIEGKCGAGLVDYMVKTQVDPETGDELPPFGVGGGTSEEAIAPYKKIKGYGVENDALYLIKAHANENTEMFAYAKAQMFSGKVKFLIDESQAKAKLMSTKMGQEMNPDDRNEYLKPFVMTDILKEQMLRVWYFKNFLIAGNS